MPFRDVILAAGARTPFGDFGKSLKDVPLATLGAHVVRASLARAGLDVRDVDHLVFGNTAPVDHDGLFVSRKVALMAGLPVESASLGVVRACGTGSQAIISAAEQILTGHSKVAVAAGGENYSRVPHLVHEMRWGAGRGPVTMVDGLDYIYRCPFSRELMGDTAENLTALHDYAREDMDDWGYMSQMRARGGIESGFLARQIAPLDVPEGKAARSFAVDEFPRPSITREKLATLKPAFRKDGKGRVTAGNSSGVTDGAAALVVAARGEAERLGIRPEARLIDYAVAGVPPEIMGAGPVPAIAKLLERVKLKVSDIDYFEINEAFAVVNLHAEKQLGIPRAITNLYGGGISIGHPPGATGLRMTMTAMHHLADTKGRYAIISMCLGSGMGMATLIENLDR
ncbi:MAG: thiolase family protein [Burkholderiales bacterium]|nr:thiolase family protein [Burkholderiales bacterium]